MTEPKTDPWVQRAPEKDEKPEDNEFYARDDKNEGTLYYQGTLPPSPPTSAGSRRRTEAVFLRVYADDKPYTSQTRQLAAGRSYAFTVKLKPGLIKYRVEFATKRGGQERVLHRAGNLVCGDAYLINGQSNALATDTGEKAPLETSDWIRTYIGPTGRRDGSSWARDHAGKGGDPAGQRPNLWRNPVWKDRRQTRRNSAIGAWNLPSGCWPARRCRSS